MDLGFGEKIMSRQCFMRLGGVLVISVVLLVIVYRSLHTMERPGRLLHLPSSTRMHKELAAGNLRVQTTIKGWINFSNTNNHQCPEREPLQSTTKHSTTTTIDTTMGDTELFDVCGPWIEHCQRECRNGGDKRIPRIVHFIKDKHFTFSDWLAVVAARKFIKPKRINIFTQANITIGCWLKRTLELPSTYHIPLLDTQWVTKVNNVSVTHVEHQSDLLRNAILYHKGGVYMDTDAIATKSFNPLFTKWRIILGRNLAGNIGNGLIMAEKHNCLICDYASNACKSFDGSWIQHSTVTLTEMVQSSGHCYRGLSVLSNDTGFFPFSWTRKDMNKMFITDASKIPYEVDQAYALHLFLTKFHEEKQSIFKNLRWLRHKHSPLAQAVRQVVDTSVLEASFFNETLCSDVGMKVYV